MLSIRCKMVVKSILEEMNLAYNRIDLGEAVLASDPEQNILSELNQKLIKHGLELMNDRQSILIEKIKNIIIEMIHYSDEPLKVNFSNFLSEKLNMDYSYLSSLFSQVKGITIEHFIIEHKIEKIKEMLLYDELSISEIANKMNYSSLGHLSNQFKKVTGLSPSHFKSLKRFNERRNIDDL